MRVAPDVVADLDRRNWPIVLGPYAGLGHRCVVRSTSSAIATALEPVLRALLAPPGPVAVTYSLYATDVPAARFVLYADAHRVGMVPTIARVIDALLWHLNRAVAAAADPELVLLHGAAAAADGRVVVLPAASGAGKSTLVAALTGEGFSYLSDEIAALTPELDVVAYPKPISLRPGSWPLLALDPPPPPAADADEVWHVLPGTVGSGPLAAVIFPEVGTPTSLTPVAPVDAVAALMASSFQRGADAPRALRRLRRVVDEVPCWRLVLTDLADAVTHVRGALTATE